MNGGGSTSVAKRSFSQDITQREETSSTKRFSDSFVDRMPKSSSNPITDWLHPQPKIKTEAVSYAGLTRPPPPMKSNEVIELLESDEDEDSNVKPPADLGVKSETVPTRVTSLKSHRVHKVADSDDDDLLTGPLLAAKSSKPPVYC